MPSRHRWLASQAARAAVSVAANIAEGYGRGTQAEFLRFLDIARGSLAEVEYYLHFMTREELISKDSAEKLDRVRIETGKILNGLWVTTRQKAKSTWDHSGTNSVDHAR